MHPAQTAPDAGGVLAPLASPALDLPGIRHGFFTRQGGTSDGIYASLNCGPGSGDAIERVLENRARVAQALGAKALVTAYQVHGAEAAIVKKPWEWNDAPKADALVTDIPGIAIGVLTADCLPILLADGENRVIAAVHSGWRSAIAGVTEAAIAAMETLGAQREHIVAALGPAIAQGSYEVGEEFHERFLLEDEHNRQYFIPGARGGHYLFDLPAYAMDRLRDAGIRAINPLARDTCFEENAFFSYRRACLRNEPAYGRQVSAIAISDDPIIR